MSHASHCPGGASGTPGPTRIPATRTSRCSDLPVQPAWPAKGSDHPQYGAFAAGIVQECQLNPIPALPDEAPRNLGPVRLIGKPRKHPVGKGPGARLMFQLQGHALEQLGLPNLAYHRTKITMAAAGTGNPARLQDRRRDHGRAGRTVTYCPPTDRLPV